MCQLDLPSLIHTGPPHVPSRWEEWTTTFVFVTRWSAWRVVRNMSLCQTSFSKRLPTPDESILEGTRDNSEWLSTADNCILGTLALSAAYGCPTRTDLSLRFWCVCTCEWLPTEPVWSVGGSIRVSRRCCVNPVYVNSLFMVLFQGYSLPCILSSASAHCGPHLSNTRCAGNVDADYIQFMELHYHELHQGNVLFKCVQETALWVTTRFSELLQVGTTCRVNAPQDAVKVLCSKTKSLKA